MKKTVIFLLAAVLVNFASCDKFLDTESPSKQSDATTFGTEAMTLSGILGVYGSMVETWVYGQKLPTNWQSNTDTENAGFNFNDYRSNTSDYGPNHYYNHSSNTTIQWQALYKFAGLADAAAKGIRNGDFMKANPAKANAYLGEALVLRSLAYFEILKFWGDIPYKFPGSDPTDLYIPKSNRDEIYDDLIKDMKEVIDENYLQYASGGAVERVTKAFAKGLLARIALHAGGWSVRDASVFPDAKANHEIHPDYPEMNGCYVGRVKNYKEYYQIALDQCAEMIGDPANPHGLDPDYENIWKTVNGLKNNPYGENLYEVAFGLGHNGNIGNTMGPDIGSGVYGPMGFGGAYCHTTLYYFYSFTPTDRRRDVTTTFNRRANGKGGNEDMSANLIQVRLAKWRFDWVDAKYKELFKTNMSRVDPGINWILMRYSDIYLMFAEAMNELNGSDIKNNTANMTAREALEKVRERAFGAGSPEITKYSANFFDAVVNERAWEFGGEAIRKHDLARWGLLDKKIEAMKKALILMTDFGNQVHTIEIFDKTYSEFPNEVFYKLYKADDMIYKDGNLVSASVNRVDLSSCEFYKKGATPPPGTLDVDYGRVQWFTRSYFKPDDFATNPEASKSWRDTPAQILIIGTGLNPTSSYDYSGLLGQILHGTDVATVLQQYPIGNSHCYYRYFLAIKQSDLSESKGAVVNSYGY